MPDSIFRQDTNGLYAGFSKDLTDIMNRVGEAVREKYKPASDTDSPWPYIDRFYDDHVVVSYGDKLLSVAYETGSDSAVTLGDATEVEQVVDYKPVAMSSEPALSEAEQKVIEAATVVKEFAEKQAASLSTPPPNFAAFSVEREAKLFEAGSYPDKRIDVSESDLDTIIANHDPTLPIKIEHSDTPFDGALGFVKRIWRTGKELMGSMAFTDEAWALIERSGIKSLSSGIKRDKTGLAEVSLVRNPRIADARVFNADIIGFTTDLGWGSGASHTTQEVPKMADQMSIEEARRVLADYNATNPEAKIVFDAQQAVLDSVRTSEEQVKQTAAKASAVMQELQRMNTNNLIFKFKREGKLTPAAEKMARAILETKPLDGATVDASDTVKFAQDDGTEVVTHFAEMFVKFLEANSPVINFQEMARMDSETTLTPGGAKVFAALGVDPTSEIARGVLAEMRR